MRSFSNTPLQVDVTFVMVSNHQSKNTSANHLNKFYVRFQDVKDQNFDGFIITGAPIEQIPFEEVDYWEEMKEIMEWTKTHVTSTILSLLGSTGSLLLSLWDRQISAEEKAVWRLSAPGDESEDSTGTRI